MKKLAALGSLFLLVLVAFATGRYSGVSVAGAPGARNRVLYYVDPMHPAYRSDKPGIAPDCGMPLVPVYEGEDPAAKLQLPPGAVYVSPERQRLIGVNVEAVKKDPGSRLIRTVGHVEADGNLVYRMMAGTEGWVESVQDNPPGTLVKKDEFLATLYSREFRNAEQAYLGSLASLDRLKGVHDQDETNRSSDASLRINEEQLRSLGMGEPQIRELGKKRQITRDVTLTSPVEGVVLARSVSPGQRFEMGNEFYRIADLSKVWIVADIYGEEGQLFHPGARVRVTVRERAKTLYATVDKNPPLFDPESRTLKLRLEAQNPGFILRPDMFVDLEFSAKAPSGLSIPQEAVLDSGLRKVVYVETSDGVFEPRRVTVGAAYGDYIAVTSGLTFGERIVISGNFLIDSESRMRSPVLASATKMKDTNQTAVTKRDAGAEVGNHAQVLGAHRGVHD